MRQKAFEKVLGISPDIKAQMLRQHKGHPPDNFVESAEGSINGLPDLDADPQARAIIEGLDAGIDKVIDGARGIEALLGTRAINGHNGNGNGNGHAPEQANNDSTDPPATI